MNRRLYPLEALRVMEDHDKMINESNEKRDRIAAEYRDGRRDFTKADWSRGYWDRMFLRGVDLSAVDLLGMDFARSDLSEARLRRADLRRVNLSDANLRRADLQAASLSTATLTAANLQEANLRNADFHMAVLAHADLEGADLRGAVLTQTNLLGAYLGGADLRDTVLDPANEPNGRCLDMEDWEQSDDGWLYGYRSQDSPHAGGPDYEVGKTYKAPVFSTCVYTSCHPGLYVCRMPSHVEINQIMIPGKDGTWSGSGYSWRYTTIIQVKFRVSDLHQGGDKYRVREFTVTKVVDSD